jgi:hypothetical protein
MPIITTDYFHTGEDIMKTEIIKVKGNMDYIQRARDRGATIHLYTPGTSREPHAKINHTWESFCDVYLSRI